MIVNVSDKVVRRAQSIIGQERRLKPLLVELLNFYLTGRLARARDLLRLISSAGFISEVERADARRLLVPLDEIISPTTEPAGRMLEAPPAPPPVTVKELDYWTDRLEAECFPFQESEFEAEAFTDIGRTRVKTVLREMLEKERQR